MTGLLFALALLVGAIAPGQAPLDGLTVRSCCRGVDVLLVDPQGRKTGVGAGSRRQLTGIPRSSYDPNTGIDDDVTGQPDPNPGKEIEVMGPEPGVYGLDVAARADTRYRVDVRAFDQGSARDARRSAAEIGIARGQLHRYQVRYDRGPVLVLSGAFGGGGEATEVDRLLAYAWPSQPRTELSAGTQTVSVVISYGEAIGPDSFAAQLNGRDVSGRFRPVPNSVQAVSIPLRAGTNELILVVSAATPKGTVIDRDTLRFIVPD